MAESFDTAQDMEIIRQFFAGEKNRVGDYWGKCMAQEAFDRLQSAHAAEVAEVRESARHEAVAMGLLADRAMGLLRGAVKEARITLELESKILAFLSEQAGERENATKDSAHED